MTGGQGKPELQFQGVVLSSGWGLGKARRISAIDLDRLSSFRHTVSEVSAEVARFRDALNRSREQIAIPAESENRHTAEIFQAQLLMVDDDSTGGKIIDRIRETGLNAEYIITETLFELREGFESIENETMRAKALDIQDVYHRVLGNLLEIDHVRSNPLRSIPPETVLISQRLLPSDIVHMDVNNLSAIVTETGSRVSHTAILARTLHIPYVAGIPGIASVIRTNDLVLVNANEGIVTVHPQSETVDGYNKRTRTPEGTTRSWSECRTKNGTRVRLYANVSTPEDIEFALSRGAEGVGLFRTEFQYIRREKFPSKDEETRVYRDAFSHCHGKPLCFRLFDFGGDKIPVFSMPGAICRSSFGNRGIRYLLENEPLLNRQIECIAEAAGEQRFEILIPFVTTESELQRTVRIVEKKLDSLEFRRTSYRLGMMLEVPSAYFFIDKLLPYVEFVSLGSNDFVQYAFAVAREAPEQPDRQDEINETVYMLTKEIIRKTNAANKGFTICGEIASRPTCIPSLLEADVRSFSVGIHALEEVRKAIESTVLG